ncbi:DUF2059 domain-containing protein [Rugamonas sp.]|uniref:DUF2059 domain-containing protein n=1 Tax=Rugamonas sp. TaxID=1926287 RepID=UPI0025F9AA9C|nr:DUF2059 domain-containing protein [Rugamonas sp.]
MLKTTTFAALLICAAAAAADNPAAAQPAPASASASAAVSPAKQQLAQSIFKLMNLDSIGETMLGQPVGDALQQARGLLQGRVATEKRDATMGEITVEAKKFMEDAAPITRASADKLIPQTVTPLLAAHFSEDELRQILAILESPVRKKFEAMLPELQKKLGESVAADTGPVINPKLKGLQERIGLRLRTAIAP